MLKITFKDLEMYDNVNNKFTTLKGGSYTFENSLKAMAKWEAKWKIPFYTNDTNPKFKKTTENILDYFSCMCLEDDFDVRLVTNREARLLTDYISDSQTATWFSRQQRQNGVQTITTEVIYASMAMAQVPFSCDEWNITRLTTLLHVIANKSEKPKMMSRSEILSENARLNAERKKMLHTKG